MSERGYTLRVTDTTLPRGDHVLVSFRIDGPGGVAVQQYRTTHEKEMHLILVRRDLSSFQHLHPTRDSGGTWTTTAELSAAGTYRLFADFAPAELGGPAELSVVAAQLNARPRKTLAWDSPAKRLAALLERPDTQ